MTSKNRFILLDDDISTSNPMSPPVEKTLKFGKKLQSTPQWVSQTVATATVSAPAPIPAHVVKTNSKGKKHNSLKNKEHLLKMMQNAATVEEIHHTPPPQPALEYRDAGRSTGPSGKMNRPKGEKGDRPTTLLEYLEYRPHSTWVTISVPDKTRPANCKMENYRLEPRAISPEQPGRAFLRTRAMNYKTFRENYIRNYGPDEYDRRYMCPHYDYHWASRSTAYVPDIYDTYPPEYLPYMLMKNGTVRDFTYSQDNTEELNPVCDFTYSQDNTEELNPVCDDLAEYVSDEEPVEKFTKYTKFLSS